MSVHYGTEKFHIDKDGVCEPIWRIGKLEWREIREVFLKQERARDYVCIVVRDRAGLHARLGFIGRIFSTATRAAGCGDLSINAAQRGIQAGEIVEFASEMITASLAKKKADPVGTDNDRAAPGRV
ncbi:MAG: hypothetical protein HZA31_05420 [Opitutae bacterium]|nr:hypothetical protein [Opitutae bacterium]